MGVEKTTEPSSSKINKSNSVDVYIPPALRRNLQTAQEECELDPSNCVSAEPSNSKDNSFEASNAQSTKNTSTSRVRRERRPDRAVYVPRARRSLTTPPQVSAPLPEEQTTSSNISQSNKSSNNAKRLNTNQKRNIDREANGKIVNGPTRESSVVILNCDTGKEIDQKTSLQQNSLSSVLSTAPNFKTDKGCDSVDKNIESIDSTNIESNNIMNHSKNITEKKPENTALRIEDVKGNKIEPKGDNEIEELQRASKEINRRNRRIMKQTFNSDVLEIPEKAIVEEEGSIKEKKKEKIDRVVDPENDDWDSMYDDNGDCVDPKILEELNTSVGKVKIEAPKRDYTAYHLKQSILSEEEFPHVLEVSNFPVEFKTQDLMMIFSTYKESGFDIKWVDDTHALAVFSSSRIAAEVLAMGHPFVLLKPLAEATVESRAKAKKCSSSLQPYRPRPETCAALARRLVTGALGVRLKTAAQERENEKRVLKEAKERKLLAAKQRDEAWES